MDTIRELFKKIRFSDLEIKSLLYLKAKMEESALNIKTNNTEKVSGSKSSEGVYGIIDGYVDLEKTISDKSRDLIECKKKALCIVNCLDNPVHRIVLIERYFNAEPWKSIAIHINMSEKWTRNLHYKALMQCSKVVQKTGEFK